MSNFFRIQTAVRWLFGPTLHTSGRFPLNLRAVTRKLSIANVAFVFISYSCATSVMAPRYKKVWFARSDYKDVSCPLSILEMVLLFLILDLARIPERA